VLEIAKIIEIQLNTAIQLFSITPTTCFGPMGHCQVGRTGRFKTQFWIFMEISVSYIYLSWIMVLSWGTF